MDKLLEVLQLLWGMGVRRVSPGALGMSRPETWLRKPYEKHELEAFVEQTPGVRWDGDWMVRDD